MGSAGVVLRTHFHKVGVRRVDSLAGPVHLVIPNGMLHNFATRSPIRSVGFSSDGEYLAIGGEDHHVDIVSLCLLKAVLLVAPRRDILTSLSWPSEAHVETGKSLHALPTPAPCNTLSWHPARPYLAYACDEVHGTIRVFGV